MMRRRVWLLITLLLAGLLAVACSGQDRDLVLFEENFESENGPWGEDERGEFRRGFSDGEYVFQFFQPNWFAWARPDRSFADVKISVDARLASGASNGHFGVLCRYVDEGNFYYLGISDDGFYGIFRRVDGGAVQALTGNGQGMVSSEAIRTGGVVNRIRAVCQDERLSLYANNELLETVADDAHPSGDVGIAVGTGSEGEARVHFDNFVVATP